MSEDRTDRRHIGQSHIQRINDWIGSNSYVEGARRDPEDTIMYESEKHPFILTQKAEHAGRLLRPGEIVHLHPEEVGTHHAKLSTHKYPDDENLKDMPVVVVDAPPMENEVRPEPVEVTPIPSAVGPQHPSVLPEDEEPQTAKERKAEEKAAHKAEMKAEAAELKADHSHPPPLHYPGDRPALDPKKRK